MKTICIMNLKGGVGKTVTAGNLADMSLAELDVPGISDVKVPWRLRDLLLVNRTLVKEYLERGKDRGQG